MTFYFVGMVWQGHAYLDRRTHEQGVEPRKDAKHLVGRLGSTELVTKLGNDTLLNVVDALVVLALRVVPLHVPVGANFDRKH